MKVKTNQKLVIIFFCVVKFVLLCIVCIPNKAITNKKNKPRCVYFQKGCQPNALSHTTRAKEYPGVTVPRYYQGYPYFGYYLYGSSQGYSYTI